MYHRQNQKKVSEGRKVKVLLKFKQIFKIDHEKKETSYTNPDAWGRLIGRINTSPFFWKVIWILAFWMQALNCP